MSRLGIVTALMCEAVPLIDLYRLQKQTKQPGFHYYRSEKIDLVIGGVGDVAMRYGLQAFCNKRKTLLPEYWLNVGIAGAKSFAVGDLLWVDEIDTTRITSPNKHNTLIKLLSRAQPDSNYHPEALFDMEAQSILDALTQNCTDFVPKNFFCAKVISDNSSSMLEGINKLSVTQLIRDRVEEIDSIVSRHITQNETKK